MRGVDNKRGSTFSFYISSNNFDYLIKLNRLKMQRNKTRM